jgi:hypothetical protein
VQFGGFDLVMLVIFVVFHGLPWLMEKQLWIKLNPVSTPLQNSQLLTNSASKMLA